MTANLLDKFAKNNKIGFMKYIKRYIEEDIKRALKIEKVVAICGARQVGKTTLMFNIFKQSNVFKYYNLDNIDLREYLKTNGLNEFKNIKEKIIAIDEIQKLPELFEIIKIIVDAPKNKKRFLITGSSQILLLKNLKETLSGRIKIFSLFPFSFFEIINVKKKLFLDKILSNNFKHYFLSFDEIEKRLQIKNKVLYLGSYPETLIRENKQDIIDWYLSYRNTYLERDLLDIARVNELVDFSRTHKLTAFRATNLINYSDIAKDAGISVNSVKQYIHYLNISYQTFFLFPYYRNIGKRLIKAPKAYFTDIGIMRSLLNDWTNLTGQIYENFIISELYKYFIYKRKMDFVHFFRTSSGVEADLFYEDDKIIYIFEVKKRDKIYTKDFKNIKKIQNYFNKKVNGIIIYQGKKIIELDKNIYAIPDIFILGN